MLEIMQSKYWGGVLVKVRHKKGLLGWKLKGYYTSLWTKVDRRIDWINFKNPQ